MGNTISNIDNRRAMATLQRVTSTRRKRSRSNNSHTNRQQNLGNTHNSRASTEREIHRQQGGFTANSTVRHRKKIHIRSYYEHGHRQHDIQGFSVQPIINTYTGVIQIGGQENGRPISKWRAGRGNKSVIGRCNLAAMREGQAQPATTTGVSPINTNVTGTSASVK